MPSGILDFPVALHSEVISAKRRESSMIACEQHSDHLGKGYGWKSVSSALGCVDSNLSLSTVLLSAVSVVARTKWKVPERNDSQILKKFFLHILFQVLSLTAPYTDIKPYPKNACIGKNAV